MFRKLPAVPHPCPDLSETTCGELSGGVLAHEIRRLSELYPTPAVKATIDLLKSALAVGATSHSDIIEKIDSGEIPSSVAIDYATEHPPRASIPETPLISAIRKKYGPC